MVGVVAISSVLKTDVPSGIASSSLAPSAKHISSFCELLHIWVLKHTRKFYSICFLYGALTQLARVSALHAEGRQFKSDMFQTR